MFFGKRDKAGFHAIKSEFVDAPLIDELPVALECKVKSFEDGILIGEIVTANLICDKKLTMSCLFLSSDDGDIKSRKRQ